LAPVDTFILKTAIKKQSGSTVNGPAGFSDLPMGTFFGAAFGIGKLDNGGSVPLS